MNDVALHHEVVVNDVCRVGVVGVNTAYFCHSQIHLGGFYLSEEGLHSLLVAQIKFGVGAITMLCAATPWANKVRTMALPTMPR